MAEKGESSKKTDFKTTGKPKISADDVIEAVGFGPVQFMTYVCATIAISISYIDSNAFVFTAMNTNYRCHVTECEANASMAKYSESWLSNAIPFESGHESHCSKFQPLNTSSRVTGIETCPKELFDPNHTVPCTDWINEVDYSIVTEFKIQCNVWKRALVGTANGIGLFVGMIYIGYLADKFGPQKLMTCTGVIIVVGRLVQSFINEYWSFIFFEFLIPALTSGCYGVGYVLGVEMATPKYRVIVASVMFVFLGIFSSALGFIAWVYPHWRTMLRVTYGPALILAFTPLISLESVRWLIIKERWTHVIDYVKTSRRWKNDNGPDSRLSTLIANLEINKNEKQNDEIKENNVPIFEIIKHKKLLIRMISCSYCWITCTFIIYGLIFNSVNLSGNVYQNFILLQLADIPTKVVLNIMLSFIGRRKCLILTFASCTIMCIVYAFVPADKSTIAMAVYIIVKFFAVLAIDLLYIYTVEIFPTSMRSSCLIFCSMVARVGNIVSPQIVALADGSNGTLLLAYGGISALATFLPLLFPETKGTTLPDNIGDVIETEK